MRPMKFSLPRYRWILLIFMGALGFSLALDSSVEESRELREKVKLPELRAHQRALQTIADNNRGTRVAGSAGYRESVSYVAERMRRAGYHVLLQDFPLMTSKDLNPPELI